MAQLFPYEANLWKQISAMVEAGRGHVDVHQFLNTD